MKCGTVTLIGRPNVGKSSLINALLKIHALIISPKPQTTRNSIRCIYNDDNAQIIFTDTPGLFRPSSSDKLGVFLNEEISGALENSDVILWLVDASTQKLSPDDREISSMLPKKIPVILAANKADKSDPSKTFALYDELCKFSAKISVSALKNFGIDELLAAITPMLPESEPIYDPDILMDTTEKFLAGEIIREKILMLLRDEVPHCVAVEIEDYKSPDEYPDRKKLYIRAALITETDGQKKIVIGSNGSMIKRIGELARNDLEELSGFPVYLELWAKTLTNWRKNNTALRRLGYS